LRLKEEQRRNRHEHCGNGNGLAHRFVVRHHSVTPTCAPPSGEASNHEGRSPVLHTTCPANA
jgi:hypothetical protein